MIKKKKKKKNPLMPDCQGSCSATHQKNSIELLAWYVTQKQWVFPVHSMLNCKHTDFIISFSHRKRSVEQCIKGLHFGSRCHTYTEMVFEVNSIIFWYKEQRRSLSTRLITLSYHGKSSTWEHSSPWINLQVYLDYWTKNHGEKTAIIFIPLFLIFIEVTNE